MKLSPYLFFDGQCEAAFKHYEKVLGGKIISMLRYRDLPPGNPGPDIPADRIMHACLFASGAFLMGSDETSQQFLSPRGFSVSLSVDEPEQAERIFGQLAEGGAVKMPMVETFWAERFGMLTDRFGIHWMINCDKGFSLSREFDVSRETLWNAFTNENELKEWWGPKGMKVVSSKLDLRKGGIYHYGLAVPDKTDVVWGKFVFRKIVKPERLVFVSSFSDENGGVTRHPMAPQWPLQMLSTFGFTEHDGKATFTVTWKPLNPSPEEQAAFEEGQQSMTQGWGGTLEKLGHYLAGRRA